MRQTHSISIWLCCIALFGSCAVALAQDGKDKPETPAVAPAPAPAPTPAPAPPAAPAPYRFKPAAQPQPSAIGSLDRVEHKLHVEFSSAGAAINKISSSEFVTEAGGDTPYVIAKALVIPGADGQFTVWDRPFSADAVTINKTRVTLWGDWEKVSEGVYRATIVDLKDQPVLEIVRAYTLGASTAGYDVQCKTQFINRTGQPLELTWEQNTLGDVTADDASGNDLRGIIASYYNLKRDADKIHLYTDGASVTRIKAIDHALEKGTPIWPVEGVTANADDPTKPNPLVWLAMVNRYFAVVVHRPVPKPPEGVVGRVVGEPITDLFEPVVQVSVGGTKGENVDHRATVLTLKSKTFVLAAGKSRDIDLCLYAGPRESSVFNEFPFDVLEFNRHLIKFEQGCSWCLFQWMADLLLWFLKLIHAIVFDWAFAIIILVLVVRLLLHPLTKKSQISMARMSKQMAELQPEMAKIKERYKNDPQKQQQETMRLYREKQINPAGFLGCLPMFLQMPIWAALYAMLYGAFELRQQHAFWGIFQAMGDWNFLRDLSRPDQFIVFAEGGFHLPLCGVYIPYAINILPLLMTIVFYLQQQMTMPKAMNEQQEQQQKMMKYMTLLFPVMLYSAPAGLTLYIFSSSIAGMVDSHYVRKHIKAEEAAGTLLQPKRPKPGGFFDRLQKAMEAKQKQMLEQRKQQGGGGGGGRKR